MGFSTRQIHAGVTPDPSTGSILTPIYQTTTYVQPSVDEYLSTGYSYSRSGNPTVRALELKLADLEGGGLDHRDDGHFGVVGQARPCLGHGPAHSGGSGQFPSALALSLYRWPGSGRRFFPSARTRCRRHPAAFCRPSLRGPAVRGADHCRDDRTLRSWSHSGFSVWAGPQIQPDDTDARLFIAEYLHKTSLKLNKITLMPAGEDVVAG